MSIPICCCDSLMPHGGLYAMLSPSLEIHYMWIGFIDVILYLPPIHFHAMLCNLPHAICFLQALLSHCSWLKQNPYPDFFVMTHVWLVKPTWWCGLAAWTSLILIPFCLIMFHGSSYMHLVPLHVYVSVTSVYMCLCTFILSVFIITCLCPIRLVVAWVLCLNSLALL